MKYAHASYFLVNHIIVCLCAFQNVIEAQNNDEMSFSSIFKSTLNISTRINLLSLIIPPFK